MGLNMTNIVCMISLERFNRFLSNCLDFGDLDLIFKVSMGLNMTDIVCTLSLERDGGIRSNLQNHCTQTLDLISLW